ncbi:MAG: hypothetical protein MJ025_00870 [Victivallaceae bacterium]|nr:hypothetical protein [Victivallaceae bacterium]
MKNSIFALVACAVALQAGGCMKYTYDGDSAKIPTVEEDIRIISKNETLNDEFRVLGTAEVSGDYDNIPRAEMIDKLRKEAAEKGADAIMIVEQSVLPKGVSTSGGKQFQSGYADDSSNQSWNSLSADVDMHYGRIFPKKTEGVESAGSYTRTIRAKFIKFE